MGNQELARLLNQVADAYALEGVEWKPDAYRKAATSLQHLDPDVAKIYQQQGMKGLTDLPGIGKAIAEHIVEYLESGRIRKLEKLLKKNPPALSEVMQIEGLGPKKTRRLLRELKIASVEDLRIAAQTGRIRTLPGFGEKTERNILLGIQTYNKGVARRPLAEMQDTAEAIITYLRAQAKPHRIDCAGSIRRRKDTVGDIDILVLTDRPAPFIKTFTSMPSVQRILSSGTTRSSVVLHSGIQVDLRVVAEESYASALFYFTGSKEHNITVRKIANQQGYLLSEYGLFTLKSKKRIPCKTEQDIYRRLGLDYIPPELRESRGEIAAAQAHHLPVLVTQKDLRGDLHVHTTFSDGNSSLRAMIQQAQDSGYSYIAITDHSRSARIANGLEIPRLKQQWRQIDKLADEFRIRIIKGAEVDILRDGSLDYPDEILQQLHVVVGAVHSSFHMSTTEQTRRLVSALSHPCLDILAHPGCRLIRKREALQADYGKIFKAAAANNKILEINCQPSRMDLHDEHILQARELGVKFCISTDAHHTSELAFIDYGVGLARRGWLTKADVINSSTLNRLRKYLPRIPP